MTKLFYCDECAGVWFDLNEVKKIHIDFFEKNNIEKWYVNFVLNDGSEHPTPPLFRSQEETINYVNYLLKSNGLLAKYD